MEDGKEEAEDGGGDKEGEERECGVAAEEVEEEGGVAVVEGRD